MAERGTGMVKVGATRRLTKRRRRVQLLRRKVITVEFAARVTPARAHKVEAEAHRLLAEHHVSGDWFRTDAETAMRAIDRAFSA